MEKATVIKIGGNIIDDEQRLLHFLETFATIDGKKILVHGGGKLATTLATRMGVPQEMVDGRRITGAETIKIVTMVYAGYINKNIVARLQALQCNAMGITGADANCISAVRRPIKNGIDFGFVGDVLPADDNTIWQLLLNSGIVPVVAPITHDGQGQLLNTNADTVAQEVARLLSKNYTTELLYIFEKKGVLKDSENDSSVIREITPQLFAELKEQNIIVGGMLPKMENAFEALRSGVGKVKIGQAEDLLDLVNGIAGTSISYE